MAQERKDYSKDHIYKTTDRTMQYKTENQGADMTGGLEIQENHSNVVVSPKQGTEAHSKAASKLGSNLQLLCPPSRAPSQLNADPEKDSKTGDTGDNTTKYSMDTIAR